MAQDQIGRIASLKGRSALGWSGIEMALTEEIWSSEHSWTQVTALCLKTESDAYTVQPVQNETEWGNLHPRERTQSRDIP